MQAYLDDVRGLATLPDPVLRVVTGLELASSVGRPHESLQRAGTEMLSDEGEL